MLRKYLALWCRRLASGCDRLAQRLDPPDGTGNLFCTAENWHPNWAGSIPVGSAGAVVLWEGDLVQPRKPVGEAEQAKPS